MSEYDPFIISLRNDFKTQGIRLPEAADKAKMSLRQFARHLRGETKEGIMPVRTVAELRKEQVISAQTAEAYLQGIKRELRLKKERPLFASGLRKFIKASIAQLFR